MDADKDGQISLQDFALHYKLPTSAPVQKIFSIFDRVIQDLIFTVFTWLWFFF